MNTAPASKTAGKFMSSEDVTPMPITFLPVQPIVGRSHFLKRSLCVPVRSSRSDPLSVV